MESWTEKYNKNAPMQWTCGFIGWRIESNKNTVEYIFKPGVINLGDYFTKHHSPANHRGMIPVYLHCPKSGHASARLCYSKCNSNRTQGKTMLTGFYNNTES